MLTCPLHVVVYSSNLWYPRGLKMNEIPTLNCDRNQYAYKLFCVENSKTSLKILYL